MIFLFIFFLLFVPPFWLKTNRDDPFSFGNHRSIIISEKWICVIKTQRWSKHFRERYAIQNIQRNSFRLLIYWNLSKFSTDDRCSTINTEYVHSEMANNVICCAFWSCGSLFWVHCLDCFRFDAWIFSFGLGLFNPKYWHIELQINTKVSKPLKSQHNWLGTNNGNIVGLNQRNFSLFGWIEEKKPDSKYLRVNWDNIVEKNIPLPKHT